MRRARSDRVTRAVAAAIVLLAHVGLIWIFLLPRIVPIETEMNVKPVVATLIDQPRPRNHSFGPVSITVRMENVLHLQRLAPKIQDIPVQEPEPVLAEITVPEPASVPLPQLANSGLDGGASETSGESGGGFRITLLQKVIPRYPEAAARRKQEGATGVLLRVDASGRVRDVKVTRSSGSGALDRAAVEAFRKWRFAPMPSADAPDGVWLRTEQRFILYRFRYSRLGDRAAENVHVEELQPAKDVAIPGSKAALRRFIDEVRSGTVSAALDSGARLELEKMRTALQEWGGVKSIEFTGTAGARTWTGYRVRHGASDGAADTVEVKWNLFEVEQENATTEWLVAVDRRGTVWAARASPAPWL
jgi:protein TonB